LQRKSRREPNGANWKRSRSVPFWGVRRQISGVIFVQLAIDTDCLPPVSNSIANEYKETTDGGRRFVVSLYSLDMNRLSGIGTCVLKRKGNGDLNGGHCSFRCFGSCRNCKDLFRPTSACPQASNPIANEYKETTDGGRRFVVSLYSLDMNRLSGIGTCVLKRKGNGDSNGALFLPVFWILPELRRLVPAYFYSRVQVTIRGRDRRRLPRTDQANPTG
jgi:hypothetical protein